MEYRIGAMSPPLHEQLGIDQEALLLEQKALDSLNYLRIHQYVTHAEFDRAIKRVLKEADRKVVLTNKQTG